MKSKFSQPQISFCFLLNLCVSHSSICSPLYFFYFPISYSLLNPPIFSYPQPLRNISFQGYQTSLRLFFQWKFLSLYFLWPNSNIWQITTSSLVIVSSLAELLQLFCGLLSFDQGLLLGTYLFSSSTLLFYRLNQSWLSISNIMLCIENLFLQSYSSWKQPKTYIHHYFLGELALLNAFLTPISPQSDI